MTWPTFYGLYYPYPTGTGQILGLIGCIAWAVQVFGQTYYICWRHTHRQSPSDRLLKSSPPVEYAIYRAWAGVLLALSNLGGDMLQWNIALVVQPHLLILFGLFEFAARHGMDGDHKVGLTVWILFGMAAVEVGVLYVVQDVPLVLFAVFVPVLITLLGAVGGLWQAIKQKHQADRLSVLLMLIALVGGSTSIAAVLYTPWTSLYFGYTSLAIYSVDTLLWLCALLGAWYVKIHQKRMYDSAANVVIV